MIVIPPAIAEQFLTRRALPPAARLVYAKWLHFYWDFCFELARAVPARFERWAAFIGLIQRKTCRQGREWFSPEGQENMADTPSAFRGSIVAAFGAGNQLLRALGG